MASCRKPISTQVQQRPAMLKDFLMDDLSSCSSNGFKSFPRRHCCTTTVRFLIDIDLKSSDQSQPSIVNPNKINQNHQLLRRNRSRAAAACDAVINAVKSLPFHSVKSSPSPSVRKSVLLLSRSLSRRLRRKSFWKKQSKEEKEHKDLGQWRLFREFLQEPPPPSDQTTTTITVSGLSTSTRSSESKSDSNCNSWGESEFTLTSESSNGNDVVQTKTASFVKNNVSEEAAVVVGEDSVSIDRPTTATCSPQNAKEWLNIKEEKEQFSPVSVLDCPFEDEDEDEDEDDQTSSPFSCSLALMQGTQQKFMQKIRRFESLAQLEAVDLEKRINEIMSDSEVEDEAQAPTSPMLGANYHEDQIHNTEEKARDLAPSNKLVILKAEKLVLDLCRERMMENKDENVVMEEVLKVAEEWINGQSENMLLAWEVEEGRKVYVNDMDKWCGRWRELEGEKREVGLELEVDIWNFLLKELLLDMVI